MNARRSEDEEVLEDQHETDDDELDDDEPIDVAELEDELPEPPEEDEDEEADASLDEILADRPSAKRTAVGSDDDDDDDEDIMTALAPERDTPIGGPLPERVDPIKDRQEFVCNNCHLVKLKSQLADPARGLCRDCV